MQGYLIVNHFVDSARFSAVYDLLCLGAKQAGVDLRVRTTGDFLGEVGVTPTDKPDFALFWDKDIHTAKRLERAGWRLFNSSYTIDICDNKGKTAEVLTQAGVPTPRTVIAPLTFDFVGYNKTDFVADACRMLGLPLVIKELYGSLGEQVYLANTEAQAVQIVSSLGARPFLFQAFIAASFGRDIRVNVVGDRVIAAMERHGVQGDFRSNIATGGTGRHITLTAEQERVALAAAHAVKADFCGVDLLTDKKGNTLVCEVNSNPQFTGTFRHCGINLADAVFGYIKQLS